MKNSISLDLFFNLDHCSYDDEDCIELSDSLNDDEDISLIETASKRFEESIDFILLE
jgi:DNA helicase IV